jgi:hypothetical protein
MSKVARVLTLDFGLWALDFGSWANDAKRANAQSNFYFSTT